MTAPRDLAEDIRAGMEAAYEADNSLAGLGGSAPYYAAAIAAELSRLGWVHGGDSHGVGIRWAYEDDPEIECMSAQAYGYLFQFSRLSDVPHGGVRLYPLLTKETP